MLNVFPRRFLAYTIIVFAFGVLFAPSSKSQTIWTITVDVTKGNDPPNYTVDPPADSPKKNCADPNSSPKPSADNLYICPGDQVQWNVMTTGGRGLLTIHQKDGFHYGASSPPQQWYRGTEKGTLAYLTTAKTDKVYSYEYCVAVYDDNGSLYTHDPKIIIGGANPDVQIAEYQKAYRDLVTAIAADPNAKKKAKEQAKNLAAKINEQIQELIRLLK
jgi:hypothetical protein